MKYQKFFEESEKSDADMSEEDELGISRRDRRAAKREQAKWDELHEESEAEESGEASEEGEEELEESSESEEVKKPEPAKTTRRGRPARTATKLDVNDDSDLVKKYSYQPKLSRSQRARNRVNRRLQLADEEEDGISLLDDVQERAAQPKADEEAEDEQIVEKSGNQVEGAHAGQELRDDEIAELMEYESQKKVDHLEEAFHQREAKKDSDEEMESGSDLD